MQGEEVEDVEGKEVRAELEAHVVQPIEAVLLGLTKDTVLWHRGFLSVPKVNFRTKDRVLKRI